MSKVNNPPKARRHRTEEKLQTDEPPAAEDTIENIGSNFLMRVQKTEDDNQELLKQTREQDEKLREMDDRERGLVAENSTLKKELEELTEHHQRLKDENATLLKKAADTKKENDVKTAVFEDLVKQLETQIRELEESKAKLLLEVGSMDDNIREVNNILEKQSTVISSLKSEMDERDGKINVEHTAELKKLNKIIRDKEELLDSLAKELEGNKLEINSVGGQEQKEMDKLREELRKRDKEIKNKDEIIGPLEKERSMLSTEISKLKEEVKSKNKEIEDLRRKIDSLSSSKKAMEKTIKSLKSENSSIKSQQDDSQSDKDDEMDGLREKIIHLASKIDVLKTSESVLAQLLKSKEHHILDLRSEITELRNVSNIFKRDLSALRVRQDDNVVMSEKYDDMANNHKRLLDENKRLRQMFATKSMEETNITSEHSEQRAQLDDVTKKFKSAQERVLKLEGWMDQIFKNSDYDVVLKTATPRDSIVSLPEISSTGQPFSRNTRRLPKKKGPPVRKYSPASIRELPGKY